MTYTAEALRRFESNENLDAHLAYLALTGKLENAVRDRICFDIQLARPDVLVGRDLGPSRAGLRGEGLAGVRLDIAVIGNGGALVEAVEAKQFYTFDFVGGNPAHLVTTVRNQLLTDARRLESLAAFANGPACVQLLLLVCHVEHGQCGLHPNYDLVSKYAIANRLDREDTTSAIIDSLNGDADFEGPNGSWAFTREKSLDLGECFGINVKLTCILGSYPSKSANQ